MIVLTPFLICILGLLMFVFCDPKYPKASQIGFAMFQIGLLVTLLDRARVIGFIVQ